MFEKIDEIFKNIEDIRDDINILLKLMHSINLNANFSYFNCSFHILSKYKIFFRGF